jgi:hypothetical protein
MLDKIQATHQAELHGKNNEIEQLKVGARFGDY